ncbi:hypothetical protein ACFX2G_023325 [Malus domestica]
MGRALVFEILDKPATSCFIGICSAICFYIQKKNIGYLHVGLSYETAVAGHHWRIITSAFSHISMKAVSKLVNKDSSVHQRLVRHSVVCEVAMKKPDSAVKRAWQAEKRRIYNKSQKSEIKTRMKKVMMSFHECGGDVGDDVHIPLSHRVTEIGQKNPDIYFTNKEGKRNTERLTWGIDKERVLRGHTAVEVLFVVEISRGGCFLSDEHTAPREVRRQLMLFCRAPALLAGLSGKAEREGQS